MLGIPTAYVLAHDDFPSPLDFDTLSYNKGNSFGVGYHVGIMGMFNDKHTRVGLNYQSNMRHTFNGFSRLTGPLATSSAGNLFGLPVPPDGIRVNNFLSSNPISLPDVLTLSAYHDLNNTFALLGSVVFTGWSSFKTIQLNNVAAPLIGTGNPPAGNGLPAGSINPVTVNSTSAQNYKDTWRAALGANYRYSDTLMLRVGVATINRRLMM